MTDIFRDSTRSIPTKDPQIVRVDMEQQDIGGRKSHLPPKQSAPDMSITHVPSAPGTSGSR
jgi:hypothetical protein